LSTDSLWYTWPQGKRAFGVRFHKLFPPNFFVETIIEKRCFEDVAHAYARVRRITRHKMKTYRRSPTYVAV